MTKRLADKYIGRNGEHLPVPDSQRTDDILAVTSFLGWCEADELWGGVRADEAFLAFARILNIPAHELRKILDQ
jgi:hypothetical protein